MVRRKPPRRPSGRSERRWPLASLLVALGGAAAFASSSCLERHGTESGSRSDACAACHGDRTRGGSALLRAAPPRDLLGATDPAYPGVGAHSIHLEASATHAAFACEECHVVPERTDSPGHADDAAPAEISFGRLATLGDLQPSYDSVARRCDNSYCHRAADAVWTEPRDSATACGSCHGLPPAAPHPQSTRCSSCHGDAIDDAGAFIAPELHVNGQVDLRATGCGQCHGSDAQPAPAPDTEGHVTRSAIGVGAHAVHLSGGRAGRPLACAECHAVPGSADDFGHADGLPAELVLDGVALAHAREPFWERSRQTCTDSWCHAPGAARGGASPRWTDTETSTCSSCHGLPPPAPHPQLTDCSRCHGEIVAEDDVTIIDRLRHVDGVVDVSLNETCTSCHGDSNPAPPAALSGASSTSEPGVGAHQVHVTGTPRSRAVACEECHQVPERVQAPGHVDTPSPAELAFSGVAIAFGAAPRYTNGTCSESACHGAVFPGGHDSGGTLTRPSWTTVDGTQAACGSCHGLPPPRPHPFFSEDCGRCHENATLDGQSFIRPDLHVDGVVTFQF